MCAHEVDKTKTHSQQYVLFCSNEYIPGNFLFFFSIGGSHYQADPVIFAVLDQEPNGAHYVFIPFEPQRTAQFINMKLYFKTKWILISEIHFVSGEFWNLSFASHDNRIEQLSFEV